MELVAFVPLVVIPAGLAMGFVVDLVSREGTGVGAFVGGGFIPIRLAGRAEAGALSPRTEELKDWLVALGVGGLETLTDELKECEVELLSDGLWIEALTDLRDGVGRECSTGPRLLLAKTDVGRLTGEAALEAGLTNPPSIVPGRFDTAIADAGRDGGPIGLVTIGLSGLKKPDLLLSVAGVDGSVDRLSIVRSESDSRLDLLGFGVASSRKGDEGSRSGLCS